MRSCNSPLCLLYYHNIDFKTLIYIIMKSKNLTYTGIVTLILGIALLFMQATAINVVVMVVGGAFVLSALIDLIVVFRSKSTLEVNGVKKSSAPISIISTLSAVATGALGLWMLLTPESFSALLVYVFAAIILLAGLFHISMLGFGFKNTRFPFAFYILPLLLVAAGIVILIMGPVRMMNAIVLVTGISLIVYSVCNFLEAAGESTYQKI